MEAFREGVAFEEFWLRAVRPGVSPLVTTETPSPPPTAIVWPRDSADRNNWITAIRGTKEGWRRAYLAEPEAPGDRALSVLAELAREGSFGGNEERGDVALAA